MSGNRTLSAVLFIDAVGCTTRISVDEAEALLPSDEAQEFLRLLMKVDAAATDTLRQRVLTTLKRRLN